jgi:hypothetical protein
MDGTSAMSFLYPAFLFGALAIAVPIVLHLLRRDAAPEVPFTAVRLLKRSPVERERKRRLRDIILLAARIVALVLLAAAFARPYVRGAAPPAVRVVAVDRSYSMGPAERFATALDLARDAIDDAGAGEQVAVVAFDDRAEVVAQPGSKEAAKAALGKLAPAFGATRYRALIDTAADLDAGGPGRLIVVTDLQLNGWEGEGRPRLPAGWQLEIRDAGAPPPNLAVTNVSVRADRVVVTVHDSQAATHPRKGQVAVSVDGREVARGEYSVRPGETSEVSVPMTPPAAGVLTVSIDDPGGLAADDVRHAVLGAPDAARVLVIGEGDRAGLYLSRALETAAADGQDRDALDVEVVPGARVSAMSAAEASNYAVVALLSTRGLDRKGRETLGERVRAGAGLFVAASADVEPAALAAFGDWRPPVNLSAQADTDVTLSATDHRHPIFRPFGALAANLGQARFERVWNVAPEGWSVIARFSNGTPALLERTFGKGRVLLFASDVDRRWNDFPLHPGFVPFAIESVRYARGDQSDKREFTVVEAPAGVPPGPGVHRRTGSDTVVVNVDPVEGRALRIAADDFVQMVERSPAGAAAAEIQARQTEDRQAYWQYGLLVMIAALVAESFVGRS